MKKLLVLLFFIASCKREASVVFIDKADVAACADACQPYVYANSFVNSDKLICTCDARTVVKIIDRK